MCKGGGGVISRRVLIELWPVTCWAYSCGPCERVLQGAECPAADLDTVCNRYRSTRPVGRGVNLANLCCVRRELQTKVDYSSTKRLTLINVRSLSNKTFILHEFFKAKELDLLFLTETWVCNGDLIPFSESVPQNCDFFKQTQTNGTWRRFGSYF